MARYTWECDDCGTENEIAEAVVSVCSEHRAQCDNADCDNSAWFTFNGVA